MNVKYSGRDIRGKSIVNLYILPRVLARTIVKEIYFIPDVINTSIMNVEDDESTMNINKILDVISNYVIDDIYPS